jgi:hypothetical protein
MSASRRRRGHNSADDMYCINPQCAANSQPYFAFKCDHCGMYLSDTPLQAKWNRKMSLGPPGPQFSAGNTSRGLSSPSTSATHRGSYESNSANGVGDNASRMPTLQAASGNGSWPSVNNTQPLQTPAGSSRPGANDPDATMQQQSQGGGDSTASGDGTNSSIKKRRRTHRSRRGGAAKKSKLNSHADTANSTAQVPDADARNPGVNELRAPGMFDRSGIFDRPVHPKALKRMKAKLAANPPVPSRIQSRVRRNPVPGRRLIFDGSRVLTVDDPTSQSRRPADTAATEDDHLLEG